MNSPPALSASSKRVLADPGADVCPCSRGLKQVEFERTETEMKASHSRKDCVGRGACYLSRLSQQFHLSSLSLYISLSLCVCIVGGSCAEIGSVLTELT